jgi:hypothetical protein
LATATQTASDDTETLRARPASLTVATTYPVAWSSRTRAAPR